MAEEQERSYYGYKPQPAFNWFEASEQQLGKVQKVIKSRVDERAKNEEYLASVNKALQKVESGSNQNYQEVLTNGGFSAKEQVYDMSQLLYSNQISSKDFRKYTTNVEQSWNNMAEISENFNSTNAIFADAQAAGTASGLMDFNAQEYARTSDWAKSQMIWDKNGNGYLAKTDDKGNVIKGSAKPLSSINNLAAQMHTKVDLAARINENKELIGDWRTMIEGTSLTSDGFDAWVQAGDGSYEAYLADLQGTILSDPNDAASALADNGANSADYFWYSEGQLEDAAFMADKNAKLDSNGVHKYGIKVIKDQDNNNEAQLTLTQKETLKTQIATELKAQIGIKETPPKETRVSDSDRKRWDDNKRDRKNYKLANDIVSGKEPLAYLKSRALVDKVERIGGDIVITDQKGKIHTIDYDANPDVMAREVASYLTGDIDAYDRGKELSVKRTDEAKIGEYSTGSVYENKTEDGKPIVVGNKTVYVGGKKIRGTVFTKIAGANQLEQEEAIVDKVTRGIFGYRENLALQKTDPEFKPDPDNNAYKTTRLIIYENIQKSGGRKGLIKDNITIVGYGKDAKVKIKMKGKDGKLKTTTFPLKKGFLRDIQEAYTKNLEEVEGKGRKKQAPSDFNLKNNIQLIGQSPLGYNKYTFSYKNPDKHFKGVYEGVIAQEVPHAVVIVGNEMWVDYSKLDVTFKKVN